MGFSSVFVGLRNRLIKADNSRRPFVVHSSQQMQIVDGNLKNLELRSGIVAQVTQTTRRDKSVTIQPEQNGPRNWTMVLPILSYRLQWPSQPQLVLKIDQSEKKSYRAPDTKVSSIPWSNCLTPATSGLIAIVRDAG
jgi:hypothetical protein